MKQQLAVCVAASLLAATSHGGASGQVSQGEAKPSTNQFSQELWEVPGSQMRDVMRAIEALRIYNPAMDLDEYAVSYTKNSDGSIYIGFYKPSVFYENTEAKTVIVQKNSRYFGVVIDREKVRVVR